MSRNRQRELFKRCEPVLRGLATILRILPRAFSIALYRNVSSWRGYPGIGVRYSILLAWCKECGRNIRVGAGVEIVCFEKLSIGSNVSIHSNCYLDAGGGITIGDDVAIAHQSSILSFDHSWQDAEKPIKDNVVTFSPVIIEDDVWIGCGCRILSGATIHTRSIVAAGAVVIHDVSSGTIVGGVPAKVLRDDIGANGDR